MNKSSRRGSASRRRWRSRRRGVPAVTSPLNAQSASCRWRRELEDHCDALSVYCSDRGSQVRLGHLRIRLASDDRGISESALAELELAVMLMRAGFRIGFLPESQTRTADLECARDGTRFFAEVTAMVGFGHRRPQIASPLWLKDDDDHDKDMLTARVMARIRQKAKQLADYCAPVLLSITVPPADREERRRGRAPLHRYPMDERVVDLKRLSGLITVMLPSVDQISGVLLSLWDVESAIRRSGVRLANVHVIERARRQASSPRTRLLILNPAARFALRDSEIESLKAWL